MTAIPRLLLSESRIRPVVVMFEDLHWNDSLSLGLLKGLVGSLVEARILLLFSYRPEYEDQWKDRPRYRQLKIEPLTPESIEALLQALLGTDPTIASLKIFLVERTSGNPFFVEELVRTLVETGVLTGSRGAYVLAKPFASVQVPVSVQAVLASRIDRLAPAEKQLLQEAAVMGRMCHLLCSLRLQNFHRRICAIAWEAPDSGILVETRLFPEPEYTFKHALTHEVAYAGLLQERRREIHARILAAMEKVYANRVTEQIERLAHHAVLGEAWPKALSYLRQAGSKAVERPAYREAFALFEQALLALKHLPESRAMLEQAIDIRFEIRKRATAAG
jgi:predicted ATPase